MTELVTCGSLSILPSEISLAAVLRNGQSFRWRLDADKREWSFAWRDRVLLLKQLGERWHCTAVFFLRYAYWLFLYVFGSARHRVFGILS